MLLHFAIYLHNCVLSLQTLAASIVVATWFLVPVATIVGMIACLFSDNLAWIPMLYLAVIVYEKDVPNTGGRRHM